MPDLKLVVWNMEWLNDLFVADNGPAAFKADGAFSPNFHLDDVTVASRRQDLVGVLNELAPDIVVVVEGPNRPAELQLFFDQPELAGDWQATVQQTPSSRSASASPPGSTRGSSMPRPSPRSPSPAPIPSRRSNSTPTTTASPSVTTSSVGRSTSRSPRPARPPSASSVSTSRARASSRRSSGASGGRLPTRTVARSWRKPGKSADSSSTST
jgi:hypothetical protein